MRDVCMTKADGGYRNTVDLPPPKKNVVLYAYPIFNVKYWKFTLLLFYKFVNYISAYQISDFYDCFLFHHRFLSIYTKNILFTPNYNILSNFKICLLVTFH